jgi:photosystem II CP47 chlorophyll apoprotein
MPTFFETFPVVLLDKDGVVRAGPVVLNQNTVLSRLFQSFYGGELDGVSFNKTQQNMRVVHN